MKTKITVIIDTDVKKKLKWYGQIQGKNLSEVINIALKEYLVKEEVQKEMLKLYREVEDI